MGARRQRAPSLLLGLVFGLLWAACGGTTGEVLTVPDPGQALGPTPAGCADEIQEGMVCWDEATWAAAADRACSGRGLVLAAEVVVAPCGPGFQRGLYYRCCKKE